MSVPSSELGLSHPLSRQRVRPSPPQNREGGGGTLPCGLGVGGVPIPTTGKKLSTLPTLCGRGNSSTTTFADIFRSFHNIIEGEDPRLGSYPRTWGFSYPGETTALVKAPDVSTKNRFTWFLIVQSNEALSCRLFFPVLFFLHLIQRNIIFCHPPPPFWKARESNH